MQARCASAGPMGLRTLRICVRRVRVWQLPRVRCDTAVSALSALRRRIEESNTRSVEIATMNDTQTSATPAKRRTARTVRNTRSLRYRQSERDLWILNALGKMRFLTTGQIARLFCYGSSSAANNRLRQLFDAGLVRVWVRNLAADNIYAITPAGRQVLEERSEGSLP